MHTPRISTLLQYCNNTVGYSHNTLLRYITLDTECTRAIASTLSSSVFENAKRYRVLMVILQSHRTQNMILRCYPNVSAILWRHTKCCLLCFFNFQFPFNSQNFLFTCLCCFYTYFAVLAESIQAGALLRQKNENGYLV